MPSWQSSNLSFAIKPNGYIFVTYTQLDHVFYSSRPVVHMTQQWAIYEALGGLLDSPEQAPK